MGTLIEGNIDVKTTDGYMLRVFCIGFTRKQDMSTKKTCYAQSQQIRNIRIRWLTLFRGKSALQTLRMLSITSSLIPSPEISRRHAKVSTLFMTCTSERLRSSGAPGLT